MADFPKDLRYTKDHEWARLEGKLVRVGITHHAVDQLGDITIVAVEAKPGTKLEAGKAFGTVESVKAVSDLFAPMSGTLVEVNAALGDKPELVNQEPYGAGWMVVIEPSDNALESLLDPAAYTQHVASSEH